ncbi:MULTISPECIES: phosphatidate cytidylyltransferase [Paenibacillus]|uniref:Phosphatidate cytidylyltransferase n=1 Tax=Paenibacillus campinasensis TaxID=66347 RepID=A0ABW9T3N6_9BACL|nr:MULTISPECIES: phosphatidate cytidylyltransferase [Paenibacillus]MUG66725.1 phosphatidate cytidylyltransferase [Paenibacillus campinasensis]PAK54652.1 phosphatidate cytidylyltransferase [Paenibacillus sp. 7541]
MKQRLITGFIAGAVFLGLCFIGGLWYHFLIVAMALVGFYEFARMTGTAPFGGAAALGYAGVAALVFPWEGFGIAFTLPWEQVIWLLLFLLLLVTVTTKNSVDIRRVSLLLLGAVYIGIGFSYIAESRSAPDGNGLFWTFLLLVSIWASDAGAYFVGKWIGKHKLWPAISPNKTIEGAVGGVIIAVFTSLVFAFLSSGLLPAGQAALIGLSCAVIGQLGDLVQSAYKRVYDVKDSGQLLPGHGGILDRCDSWIIVFPFVHIINLLPY